MIESMGDSSVRGRGDSGPDARCRAQIRCSSSEMDWLITCSNSLAFLMRIGAQSRSQVKSNVLRRVWIIEAGEPGDEVQMDRAGGPVALLGDNDL